MRDSESVMKVKVYNWMLVILFCTGCESFRPYHEPDPANVRMGNDAVESLGPFIPSLKSIAYGL